MKSLAALDRPSWLSSSAWPWQPYLLSHHQGGIAVTDIGDGPAVLFVHVGSWSFVWRDVLLRLANDFRVLPSTHRVVGSATGSQPRQHLPRRPMQSPRSLMRCSYVTSPW